LAGLVVIEARGAMNRVVVDGPLMPAFMAVPQEAHLPGVDPGGG
jgi:hypothetical protein